MADISCIVCGEPWDSYGVRHGDMAKWEAELFRKGAGCPCCEGETPEGGDADEIAFQAAKHEVFCPGDDTGIVAENFIAIVDGTSKRPAWRRPGAPTKWSCAGCKARVRVDPDSGEAYFENLGKGLYNLPRDASDADPELRDWVLKLGEAEYCPCCAKVCDGDFNCEAVIFRSGEVDTHDPGASFADPFDQCGSLCYECYTKIPSCADCGEHWRDPSEAEDCCASEEQVAMWNGGTA